MVKNLYLNLLNFMIEKGYISKDDQDLYLYAMKVLIRSLINMLALFITGIVMGLLKESIFMFLSFFVLRKFAGGLHADKYIICFISSLFISVFSLLLIKNSWFVSKNIFITIVIIASFLIVILSPVKHPNKEISVKEEKIYMMIASILSIVVCVLTVLSVQYEFHIEIGYSIGTGLIVSSLLMIAGKIKLRLNTD